MAADENKVKIHEVTKVSSFSDSTSPSILPLTYFDTFWFKFPPVERLFFYQISELNSGFFNSVVLPKLRHSLSLTLHHYFPLAGSLMWPEDAPRPAIYYFPNDGVSLTVAESDADFNFLSGNGFREAVKFHHLIPQLSISEDKAEVIALQITLLPNEGFSIGISCHHAVLDGKSSTMFMKSWAYLCKRLGEEENPLLPELIPCFDRTVIKDPEGLDVVYANHWLAFTGADLNPKTRSLKVTPKKLNSNLLRATFELTREDIKKLRDKVLSITSTFKKNEDRQSKELHLSTYVLTCAYVYVCLLKAKEEEEPNTSIAFGVAADCRSRSDPPIPVNYFGNCVAGHLTTAKASDLMDENGIAFVAEKLSDLIKEMRGKAIVVSEEEFVKVLRLMKEEGTKFLSLAGSNRFDVYGMDFGWGRPKKVEIVSIDGTGAFSMAESRDGGGGVEVGVVLEKQQMQRFAALFVDGLK
ncbi:Phenolic glucoside malonyltransferase [Melia azedarach]|uniref:Phenolic glucoside malonyltransferase n=1 Tax=Melia azedarach TaxID=155640 RepID=A0ACC1X762_MELAZ|nr:Phenolic glucoside malonyltransferase [Melia azedarach]